MKTILWRIAASFRRVAVGILGTSRAPSFLDHASVRVDDFLRLNLVRGTLVKQGMKGAVVVAIQPKDAAPRTRELQGRPQTAKKGYQDYPPVILRLNRRVPFFDRSLYPNPFPVVRGLFR